VAVRRFSFFNGIKSPQILLIIGFCIGISGISGCATGNDPESEKIFKRVDVSAEDRVLLEQKMKY
jgi:hypothetical protein